MSILTFSGFALCEILQNIKSTWADILKACREFKLILKNAVIGTSNKQYPTMTF